MTEAKESSREEIAELVARAQRRDFQAFEALVAMHRAKIYALALRMIRNPSEAEELTQETFTRALQRWDDFRGQGSRSTWLCTIAKRQLVPEWN